MHVVRFPLSDIAVALVVFDDSIIILVTPTKPILPSKSHILAPFPDVNMTFSIPLHPSAAPKAIDKVASINGVVVKLFDAIAINNVSCLSVAERQRAAGHTHQRQLVMLPL